MKTVCWTQGIMSIENPGRGIKEIVKAGFENVALDLSHYQSRKERFSGKELLDFSKIVKLLEQCETEKLSIALLKVPCVAVDIICEAPDSVWWKMLDSSIQLCGRTDCGYIIIPTCYAGNEWDKNRAFYLRLAETARQNKVKILLINQSRDVNGHIVRGCCSDGEQAAEWIDKLNHAVGEECFGFCLDTGVCNACGQDMQVFARELGKRLKAVILRDSIGGRDSALLPFTGVVSRRSQTDWLSLIRGLREIAFQGMLVLNMADTGMAMSHLLHPGLLYFAKEIMDYLKWQIEMEMVLEKYNAIVLFGAGNMCRNFMRCYGKKHVPLFICDNNSQLWGKTLYGLEVKSPENLTGLPKDCGVFICNVYYHEIAEQLKNMGMEHVEYFSDEFLPSYPLDS